MSRSIVRWVAVTVAALALALPIQAQTVLTVRIESFEALVEDVDKIAVALGQPEGSAENWLQMAQDATGMPDFDWVDRRNPVVLALPLEGMMLGQKGFVGALPVADVDAAIAAMRSAVEGVTVDENGLIHLPTGGENETLFLPTKGYLVFGQNANLIGGFDPTDLLSGAHMPPGTIAAEFNVDSMRAMIGMALQGLRQQVAAGIAAGAGEGNEAVTEEAVTAIADTVVGWIQSLVENTRSVQLALEVTDNHVIVHNHYLPASGSTLEGFLRAQDGGMPDVARLLDDDGASFTLVGNVTWTAESMAAFEGFMEGYGALVQQSIAGNEELEALGIGSFSEMMPAMMGQYTSMMKCMRGDMAQVVDLSDGLSFTQVAGLVDADECRDFNQQMIDMFTGLPEALVDLMSVQADALTHRGVTALSYGFDVRKFVDMPNDEDFNEVMSMFDELFGKDGFKAYMAQAGQHVVVAGGVGSDAAVKQLIDRIMDKKAGDGIDASAFAPFDVGAGLYVMADLGRMFDGLGKVLPSELAGSGDLADVQELFIALGRMTGGVDLRRDALGLKFALPTSGLSTIAEMARREAVSEADVDEDRDHHREDHDGGRHDRGKDNDGG